MGTWEATASEELYKLATSLVAAPHEQLALAESEDSVVRSILAKNASLTAEAAGVLARDEHPDVRELVARRLDLGDELALVLARDPSWLVRHALAGNVRAPLGAQLVLASDTTPEVVVALGANAGLVLTAHLPLAFLRGSGLRTRRFLDESLRWCDPTALAKAPPDWDGTLGELLTIIDAMSPERP